MRSVFKVTKIVSPFESPLDSAAARCWRAGQAFASHTWMSPGGTTGLRRTATLPRDADTILEHMTLPVLRRKTCFELVPLDTCPALPDKL